MKLKFFQLAVVVILLGVTACNNTTGQVAVNKDIKLNNELDSMSYSLGVIIGSNLKRDGAKEINIDAFATALTLALKGDSVMMNRQQAQMILSSYFENVRIAKMQKNLEEGKKWLEENAKKDGVITTASGLQYKIIKKGDGPLPTDTDVVKVHYKGTLIDGTKFDSSYDRGQPFETKVKGRIIQGWTEALKLMPVGSKFIFYIPTELAYGPNVRPGGPIEPNVPLIFEMELLEIVPPAENQNNNK